MDSSKIKYTYSRKRFITFFFEAVNLIEINCIVILTFTATLCFIFNMSYSTKHTANGSSITECVHSYIPGFSNTIVVRHYINCKSHLILRKEAFAYSSLISLTRFIINVQVAQRAKTGNRKSQASALGSRRENKSAV